MGFIGSFRIYFFSTALRGLSATIPQNGPTCKGKTDKRKAGTGWVRKKSKEWRV